MILTINSVLQGLKPKFFVMEKLTMAYSFVTGLIILGMWGRLDDPMQQIFIRIILFGVTVALCLSYKLFRNKKLAGFVRVGFQLSLLAYWYPETFRFNKFFPNLDHWFAHADQFIFGFQPALAFANRFPSLWISESFNFGYFSYYPIILIVTFYCYFFRPKDFGRFSVLLLGSFFAYYLIYIFLPVAGPQFYYYAINVANVQKAHFPAIGEYFRFHDELNLSHYQANGIFRRLVQAAQQAGERPTAAFPSSHVGISTTLLLWTFRSNKKLCMLLAPLYLLLCGATVYIRAHYAVDVFAGWITGALFFRWGYLLPIPGKSQ